jgi:hypothetical protein
MPVRLLMAARRDRCLTDQQRAKGQLTACVSRGVGTVTLEL